MKQPTELKLKPEENKVTEKSISIKPLVKKILKVKITGVTPILSNKMDMDVVEAIDKKKSGKFTSKKVEKSASEKVMDKVWYNEKKQICVPSVGFLHGMVENSVYVDGMDKKLTRGSIRMTTNLVPIKFKKQTINKTWGRTSGISKSPHLILRPEFQDWECELELMYNSSNISDEQIINLLNTAGFATGIGSWRPSSNGTFGQYEVKAQKGEVNQA